MSPQLLRISENLALPIDAVTQTFAILAVRGAGKTNTAVVMVEEMLEHGQRVCVVDPTGVWWGLRSSADGEGPGYPVVVFGGDHGDLPLEPSSGELVANLIVDHDLAVVLDLSLMRKGQQRQFMTDFLETLYRRNKKPLHLVIDEADLYAPQRPQHGAERLLGAAEDVVRRGRVKGLGVTLISQRPASIHKDVLSQTAVLIALNLPGPHDRAAVDTWIKAHDDGGRRDQLMGSLASMQVGEAWVWSPSWLDIFVRVQIRRRRTFDSSATPVVGQEVTTPTSYALVDLEDLRAQMAELIERAEADDPAALRKRIRELELELACERKKKAPPPQPDPQVCIVEVPVLTLEERDRLGQFQAVIKGASSRFDAAFDLLEQILGKVGQHAGTNGYPKQEPTPSPQLDFGTFGRSKRVGQSTPTIELRSGAKRMLEVLARPPGIKLTRAQVGTLAGITPSGGTFSVYMAALRRHGLIEELSQGGKHLLTITHEGVTLLGQDVPSAPRTTEEVLDLWRPALRAGAGRMLEAVVAAHPKGISKAMLAIEVGLEGSGGTFSTYLSKLKTNGLVEVSGDVVRASEALFLAPQPT